MVADLAARESTHCIDPRQARYARDSRQSLVGFGVTCAAPTGMLFFLLAQEVSLYIVLGAARVTPCCDLDILSRSC